MSQDKINKLIIIVIVFLLLLSAGLSLFIFVPYKTPDSKPLQFEITNGMSLNKISDLLEKEKVIYSANLFKVFVILTGKGRKIRSGQYVLEEKFSLYQLLNLLEQGKEELVAVTIPEGRNMKEIFEILSKSKIENSKNYHAVSKDKSLIQEVSVSGKISTLEGFLFPETYMFSPRASEEVILRKMIQVFWKSLPDNFAQKSNKVGLTMYQAIILASIIEKETSVETERTTISSVFHNRLKRRMPLATDPTVIYGIKNFSGNLTRKHLRTRTPYNTYLNVGLPPSPIASPGIKSLLAAVTPSKTDYLYFVATGDGKHKFSKTYREHNKAVNKYQRYGRKTKNYRSY